MREYHVESLELFSSHPLTLSVWRNPQLRPIIIIGQDESVLNSIHLADDVGLAQMAKPNCSQNPTDTSKCFQRLYQDHLGLFGNKRRRFNQN